MDFNNNDENIIISDDTGNFQRGLMKGFIYSLGGFVLWGLLEFVGFYASIAAYAIGYLFYLGLKQENVLITKKRLTFIVVYTIVGALLATYISTVISIMIELKVSFFQSLFTETPYNILGNSEYAPYFWLNVLIGLVMACLGAYSIYKKVKNEM